MTYEQIEKSIMESEPSIYMKDRFTTIIKITKQEAVDAWKLHNDYRKSQDTTFIITSKDGKVEI